MLEVVEVLVLAEVGEELVEGITGGMVSGMFLCLSNRQQNSLWSLGEGLSICS